MSTATLFRPSAFAYTNGFGIAPTAVYTKDNGALVLERVPVFRSGTFRDSMGTQNTWEGLHMKQMIDNWNHLRSAGIFADVPVRDGHAGWLIHNMPGNGVAVGWHTDLVTEKAVAPHDNVEYDFLFASYEITDPNAAAQVKNGTWRNRSAEIGNYVTNSEAEFWPTYMGFAYVDIPAVEGLKFGQAPSGGSPKLYVFMNDKETVVPEPTSTTAQPAAPAATGAPAQTELPFGAAPQSYSINGASTADPVAVQAHITSLENFQRETVAANRSAFVTGLAAANKIAATQIDSLTAFAGGLTVEQYATWTETFAAAPVQSVLGQHGTTVTNPDGTAGQVSAADDQIAVWQATVAMHKKAGTSKVQIEKTESYRKLVAAGKTPVL